MMEELENERGRGVCLNNQGNVYKQIGDFDQALKAYELAIVSGECNKILAIVAVMFSVLS